MTTKWGILSAGKISHDFVVCLRSLNPSDHQVVAVAARNLEDAKKFAQAHNIPRAYGSYQELADDSEVQIVYIGTVMQHHLATGKMMLEGGKHVLIEKSFTLTAKGAKELIDLARAKKLFLMEAIWSRFNPAYAFVMEKIKHKVIGDVVSVNATFGYELTKVERLIKKSAGGGAILDLGVYTLNVIQMALGNKKPSQILATGFMNEDGVDETLSVALKYPDGQVAMMSNTIRGQMANEAQIVGTKGVVKILSPFWCPTKVALLTGENLSKEEFFEFEEPKIVDKVYFVNSGFLCHEAQHVHNCLIKGLIESPILPLDDSLTIREISDEILRQIGVQFEE